MNCKSRPIVDTTGTDDKKVSTAVYVKRSAYASTSKTEGYVNLRLSLQDMPEYSGMYIVI